MTIEIEFSVPQGVRGLGQWQVEMAEDIAAQHGIPLTDIGRRSRGGVFVVSLENAGSVDVDGVTALVVEHLPSGAVHVETREV